MQSVVQSAIKLVGVGALEHHGHVFTVGPVGLLSELCLNAIEKLGSGQRVRNGNADVIGPSVSDQFDGVLNVLPGLAWISELQEVAGSNAFMPQVFAGLGNLIHARALVHGVQDLLRSRFDAHPYFCATGATQRAHGYRRSSSPLGIAS